MLSRFSVLCSRQASALARLGANPIAINASPVRFLASKSHVHDDQIAKNTPFKNEDSPEMHKNQAPAATADKLREIFDDRLDDHHHHHDSIADQSYRIEMAKKQGDAAFEEEAGKMLEDTRPTAVPLNPPRYVAQPADWLDGNQPEDYESSTGVSRLELDNDRLERQTFSQDLIGPFGTAEYPCEIPTANSSRIVGCVGHYSEQHVLLYFELTASVPKQKCPICEQVFQLVHAAKTPVYHEPSLETVEKVQQLADKYIKKQNTVDVDSRSS